MWQAYNIHRRAVNSNRASEIINHAVHRILGPEICRVDIVNVSEPNMSTTLSDALLATLTSWISAGPLARPGQ